MYLAELEKLQDQIPPFPNEDAFAVSCYASVLDSPRSPSLQCVFVQTDVPKLRWRSVCPFSDLTSP